MGQECVFSDIRNDSVSIDSDNHIPETPTKGIVSPTGDREASANIAKVVLQHNVILERLKGPDRPSVKGLVQSIFGEIDRGLRKEVVLEQYVFPRKGNVESVCEIAHSSQENRGDSTYVQILYSVVDKEMERAPGEDTIRK